MDKGCTSIPLPVLATSRDVEEVGTTASSSDGCGASTPSSGSVVGFSGCGLPVGTAESGCCMEKNIFLNGGGWNKERVNCVQKQFKYSWN